MKTIFVNKKRESLQIVINKIHCNKTANMKGILPTSRLVILSHLVMHFCCGHNVRRFAICDCT